MQQGLFEPPTLSANYTMNGTEAIVSSGIILDISGFAALEEEGEVSAANMTAATTTTNATDTNATATDEEGEFPPLPYPILDSFTVTFEQPGTHEYFCAFHPGMYGIVTVAGEEGEAAGEEGEVSAANMTAATTTTNATDTNATAVTTTPIPPAETGQENATTATEEEEQQQQQTTTTIIPAPLLE
ncbi:MAG TPA: hypothetical protein VHJ59_03465 [Nitrososphaera sp.]|nr:hypothetical protein [Nitrososphaera sp.]